eukprot:TRINITY_DN9149_c0_g1_i1.p1 TRINITY_DN9149_c0_g1~~TRINITY_DN9149_c0_g1_i1.p1  ORF type:complete len:352 (+),score=38.36 TRINITY_DN9149_c0_g1_i1:297-1352(+)
MEKFLAPTWGSSRFACPSIPINFHGNSICQSSNALSISPISRSNQVHCRLQSNLSFHRSTHGCFFTRRCFKWKQNAMSSADKKSDSRLGYALCRPAASADYTSPSSDVSLSTVLRAICFYAVTSLASIPLFVVMLVSHPFVLLFDRSRRSFQHLINKVWASISLLPFCKVDVDGVENLPPPDMPAVYVANHQSYIDIYALLLLGRSFKFISKTSIFFIPVVGWSMFLTGHIPLHRMDNKSQMECLRRCLNALKHGASVLFFPEGTRTKDGKMSAFKKGAFSIAAKAQVPVVPITIMGTGKIMPSGMEGILRRGSIKIIIKPPIEGMSANELCKEARNSISKELIRHGFGVH